MRETPKNAESSPTLTVLTRPLMSGMTYGGSSHNRRVDIGMMSLLVGHPIMKSHASGFRTIFSSTKQRLMLGTA